MMELLELAAKFGEIALAQHEMEQHALEKVGKLVEKRAKEKIGEYQEEAGPFVGWADLADSTKADRVNKGFPEDEPLLRTGQMRDSVEHVVIDSEVQVGSDSDIAVYQELGTATIPPRSFLGGAVADELPAIMDIIGDSAAAALIGGGVARRRLSIKD